MFIYLPWNPSALHVISECNVVAPDVELPLSQSENSAVNATGVNADSHVDVHRHHFPHKPSAKKKRRNKTFDDLCRTE